MTVPSIATFDPARNGRGDANLALSIRDALERLEAAEKECADRLNELRRKASKAIHGARLQGLVIDLPDGGARLEHAASPTLYGTPSIYRRQIL